MQEQAGLISRRVAGIERAATVIPPRNRPA
jgi:hypothetical protein